MKKQILLLFFSLFLTGYYTQSNAAEIKENSKTFLAPDCVNPSASYEIVPNCQYGEQFLITTTVNNLGDAASVVVSDNMGSTPQTVNAAGETVTFGPYPNGANVIVTVASSDDSTCKTQSGNLTQQYCPTGYISVDETKTAEELVDLLLDNPCAVVSNVTSSTGVDFSDGTPGIGYFDGDGTTFPISAGIILSSGDVTKAPGPMADRSDGGYNWPGDSDLDDLTSSMGSNSGTNNASVLEFDFIPFTDYITFDYLFASSEYGTFQCTFADVFAFLLTDQDGNTQNLAVLPGTSTPVSVTTIRDNAYNSSCSSVNPEYFDKFYGTNGLPGNADPITYRGYTVKLTAEANVIPGQTYHIKLAIADYSDTSYDSAVFLQAGSFDIGTVDLGPDLTVENQNAPCEQTSAILDSGIEDNEFADISWWTNEGQIEGANEPTIEVTEDGVYTVIVMYGDGGCILSDEITVEFAPVPEFEFENQDASLCGLDSIVLDGTPLNIDLFDNNDVFYTWYFEGNEIPGETDSTIEVSEPGLYEVVVSTNLGCEGSFTFTLTDAGFVVDLGGDQEFCNMDSYEITAEIEGAPGGVSFEWEGPGVDGQTGQSVTVTQSGVYTVHVITEDCVGTASVNIDFQESAIFDLGGDIYVTDLDGVVLDASPTNMDPDDAHYEWEFNGDPIPENGPFVTASDYGYGIYTVIVYGDDPDCYSTQTIEISEEEILCDVDLTANQELEAVVQYCQGESFSAYEIVFTAVYSSPNATGEVEYVWYRNGEEISADGDTYTIVYDEDGDYNDEITVEIYVDGCSASSTLNTHVIISEFESPCDITQGISPGNNDGLNDNFDLTFIHDRSGIEEIVIYNRYGRKVFDQKNYTNQWYGQSNGGKDLPTGTYYYVVKLKNEDPVFDKVIKGWVYLNQNID